MPDRKIPEIASHILIHTGLANVSDVVRKANLKIGDAASQGKLFDAFDKNKVVLKDKPVPDDGTKQHVFLNPSHPYVEGKGELRFIKPDFVHSSYNYATFKEWDSGMWIWLYGLTKGQDYSAKLKLKGFHADFFNPKPGNFLVSANSNDSKVNVTFEEQTLQVGFVGVKDTMALIYLRAEETIAWNFYEINVIQTKL